MSRTSYLSTEDERMLTLACIAPSSAEPQPKERSSVEAKDVRRLSGSFALPSDVSWLVMGRAIRQGGEPHSHPPGPLMSDALTGDFCPTKSSRKTTNFGDSRTNPLEICERCRLDSATHFSLGQAR